MKPAFFIVITASETRHFETRAAARVYAYFCKLSGHAAIVKSIGF